jgi:hypothetical protein
MASFVVLPAASSAAYLHAAGETSVSIVQVAAALAHLP